MTLKQKMNETEKLKHQFSRIIDQRLREVRSYHKSCIEQNLPNNWDTTIKELCALKNKVTEL